MSETDRERPYCFGKLENVFPMSGDGLRQSPESCMVCIYKTECLRAAMQTSNGFKVKEEALDRAYASGTVGFLSRWSRKKTLQRLKQSKKE